MMVVVVIIVVVRVRMAIVTVCITCFVSVIRSIGSCGIRCWI